MSARADAWIDSLGRLVRDTGRARVRVGDIEVAAGEGGLAAAILIFALPNALPSLPGMSSVLGAPLLVFTAQMLLGRPAWMPRWLARLSISRASLEAVMARLQAVLACSRGVSRPRLHASTGSGVMRVAGGLGCVLAMLLALPLPRVNIPIGMSLSLLSFGALRGDGLAVLLGFVAGIVALVLAASVCWGAWLLL
ncbi:exopolysaccharide biosynthesis protein [Variovorax sp. 38R]|uniref:exopolysaccharide biosynthesis protein n=1 Tax=Variovorax sp. 38R TaxID=2774875 RepID=UPI0017830890|nr:exopolysaccharide biosynthesis protein [Variovorax sp. 38R]QOF76123.1 exopolysaccharide biosynthesis protein [Variovorax sp. 38R]